MQKLNYNLESQHKQHLCQHSVKPLNNMLSEFLPLWLILMVGPWLGIQNTQFLSSDKTQKLETLAHLWLVRGHSEFVVRVAWPSLIAWINHVILPLLWQMWGCHFKACRNYLVMFLGQQRDSTINLKEEIALIGIHNDNKMHFLLIKIRNGEHKTSGTYVLKVCFHFQSSW